MKVHIFFCLIFLYLFSRAYAMHDENVLYTDCYCPGMQVIAEIYKLALDPEIQGKLIIDKADEFNYLQQTKQGVYLEVTEKGNSLNASLYAPFGVIKCIHKIIYKPENREAYYALKNKIAELKSLHFMGRQTRGCSINPATGQYDAQESECMLYQVVSEEKGKENLESKKCRYLSLYQAAIEQKKISSTEPYLIVKKENPAYKKQCWQLMQKLVNRYENEHSKITK